MSTQAIHGGRFEYGGRIFEVAQSLADNAVEIVGFDGLHPDVVARGRWDEAIQCVVDLRAVKSDWPGDLAGLGAAASAKLLREPGGP